MKRRKPMMKKKAVAPPVPEPLKKYKIAKKFVRLLPEAYIGYGDGSLGGTVYPHGDSCTHQH